MMYYPNLLPRYDQLLQWSRDRPDLHPDIPGVINSLYQDLATSQACVKESKQLVQSSMDTHIYVRGMFEIARREDLLTLITPAVSAPTRTALRLSPFDGRKCFEESVCLKAYEEKQDAIKAGTISASLPTLPRSGQNRNSGKSTHRRKYYNQQRSRYTARRPFKPFTPRPQYNQRNDGEFNRRNDGASSNNQARQPSHRGRGGPPPSRQRG